MEKRKQIKWTEELIEKLRLVWTSGTDAEISEAFSGVTKYYLRDVASRFGIKRGYEFKVKRKLSKLLDETELNYYWLGFIMADGHITKKGELKLALNIKDINHLKKFANYIDINVRVTKGGTYGKYTSGDVCTISVMDVNSIKLIRERFNIDNQKTYSSCSLASLNTNEKRLAFLCGLIDGDGCITQGKMGKANMLRIQCNSSWLYVYNELGEFIKSTYGIDYKCYIDTNGYCKFCIYHYEDLTKLKQLIESLNIPFLERKWGKIC